MHGKHGVIVSFLLTNKVWMQIVFVPLFMYTGLSLKEDEDY